MVVLVLVVLVLVVFGALAAFWSFCGFRRGGEEVDLVSYECNDNVGVGLSLQFLDPRLCLFKGALLGVYME